MSKDLSEKLHEDYENNLAPKVKTLVEELNSIENSHDRHKLYTECLLTVLNNVNLCDWEVLGGLEIAKNNYWKK